MATSPLAGTVHANALLFKYATSCEAAGQCYLVVASNEGVLHFLDAATGQETSGVVPTELWQPNRISNNTLSVMDAQPASDYSHRYYIDGGLRKQHMDTNRNGYIDNGEAAYLVVGLGRGGRGLYRFPMTTFNGVVSVSNNPVQPITNTAGSPYEELRETWNGAWLGAAKLNGGNYKVAIFPSGHMRDFDEPDKMMPGTIPGPLTIGSLSAPSSIACASVAGVSCEYYNAAGYTDPAGGLDDTEGPFSIPNAIAYRLVFSSFDLDNNDTLFVQDSLARRSNALTGNGNVPAAHSSWSAGLTVMKSSWVFDTQISWRLTTNGTQTANTGYKIAGIEYVTSTPGPAVEHYPTIYMVDMARWNDTSPTSFQSSTSGEGLLLQISRSCKGSSSSRTCLDAASYPDLAYMTCPVSAEVAVHTISENVASIYWGDECGQMFVASATQLANTTTWTVRRLVAAYKSTVDVTNQLTPLFKTRDFRKIFRRLEIVLSICPGKRVVGIYFGTGNVQRPGAFDELTDTNVTSGRDVVGVFWDDGVVRNKSLETDMVNVSNTLSVDAPALYASGKYGWYFKLANGERMLRDVIVLDGVAYFKTHDPISVANVCAAGNGTERIYSVDNCSAKPKADGDGNGVVGNSTADRVVWTAAGDIGGDPLLMVPRDGAPFVTHADLGAAQAGVVAPTATGRSFRMLHWRVPRTR